MENVEQIALIAVVVAGGTYGGMWVTGLKEPCLGAIYKFLQLRNLIREKISFTLALNIINKLVKVRYTLVNKVA